MLEVEVRLLMLRKAVAAVMPSFWANDNAATPYCTECGETEGHDDDCPVDKLQRIAGIVLTRTGWQLKGGA